MTVAGIVAGVVAVAVAVGIDTVVVDGTLDEQSYCSSKAAGCSSAVAGSAEARCKAKKEKEPMQLGYRQAEDFEKVGTTERLGRLAPRMG